MTHEAKTTNAMMQHTVEGVQTFLGVLGEHVNRQSEQIDRLIETILSYRSVLAATIANTDDVMMIIEDSEGQLSDGDKAEIAQHQRELIQAALSAEAERLDPYGFVLNRECFDED